MNVAVTVCSVLVALVLLAAGTPKALGQATALERVTQLGYTHALARAVGGVEIAGAVGLLTGLVWPAIGLSAAIGSVLLMAGAAVSHSRVGDAFVHIAPAVVVGVLAASVAAMQISII